MIKKIKRVWLPQALEALVPWFANFALKFDEFAVGLGFTAADVAKVQADYKMVHWLLEAQQSAEANLDSFRKFRDESLYGEKGAPAPVDPTTSLPAQPAVLTTNIIERLVKLVERIQIADTYTDAVGEALGIVPATGGDNVSPADVKPTIQLFPAQSGYEAAVVVANRADSDMFNVQSRPMNSDTWTTVKSGVGKSVNFTLTPTAPGQPEKFLVRVQLLKKNEPYGQPSDPAYVTVSP
ncbi:MAG: hypothetical protein M3384_09625 [Acidobacteriota bacterium]|nr:hypothetical protein [Acidobacteriota bacterium]